MSNIYILFICIALPQLFLLKLLDRKSGYTVFFEILGLCVCLLAANVNGLIASLTPMTVLQVTITFTPIVEEILKAVPIILYALFVMDDTQKLTSLGMALGTGFAILENAYILLNSSGVNILWALSRGIGSGLMHSITTGVIGFGISRIDKDPRLLTAGTYSLLTAASIFHGTYNVLVQSPYRYVGILLPLAVYVPFAVYAVRQFRLFKQKKLEEQTQIS